MRRKIAAILIAGLFALAGAASSAFAGQPPGQLGYEGQPGNQGGGGGQSPGLLGNEGQPGNQSRLRTALRRCAGEALGELSEPVRGGEVQSLERTRVREESCSHSRTANEGATSCRICRRQLGGDAVRALTYLSRSLVSSKHLVHPPQRDEPQENCCRNARRARRPALPHGRLRAHTYLSSQAFR
jgi:hypothetical protein